MARQASQERGRRTQRRILEAAAVVFEQSDYSAASLTDITEVSGVSKGAMYFHFKTKEEIAVAVINEQHNRIFKGTNRALHGHGDPVAQLIRESRTICDLLVDDVVVRAGISLALGHGVLREASARSYQLWIESVSSLLGLAAAEGKLDAPVPLEWLSRSLVSHFTGSHLMSQAISEREDLLGYVSAMWCVFISASIRDEHREHYRQIVDAEFSPLVPVH